MKICEIVKKMEAYHVHYTDREKTCDGIICGDDQKECTGIAVTCCPTAAVIKKAAAMGYNFIICHEPTFFDGWDDTQWLKENHVYQEKKKLIDETGMVIYRNHDHLHSDKPDGIFSGLIKLLGWESYKQGDGFFPDSYYVLPETTVEEVAWHLEKVMGIDGVRIIGDPKMKVTRVSISAHYMATEWDKLGIESIDKNNIELIIPGEIIDWTIGEYVQDSIALGKNRALINVGHFNLEEPGMEYMSQWLPQVIGDETPVTFIQSGNSFGWIGKQGD